jgi:hypothetical protein
MATVTAGRSPASNALGEDHGHVPPLAPTILDISCLVERFYRGTRASNGAKAEEWAIVGGASTISVGSWSSKEPGKSW